MSVLAHGPRVLLRAIAARPNGWRLSARSAWLPLDGGCRHLIDRLAHTDLTERHRAFHGEPLRLGEWAKRREHRRVQGSLPLETTFARTTMAVVRFFSAARWLAYRW